MPDPAPSDRPADRPADLPAELETASFGRRLVALFVDWIACTFVVIAAVGLPAYSDDPSSSFLTLGLYVVEKTLFTWLAGGSFGQLATRLRVVRWPDGGRIELWRCALRAVLVGLMIPPLVFKPDGRGLHDLAAGCGVVPAR